MTVQARKPAQAGTFYSANRTELERQIRGCFEHPLGPGPIPEVIQDQPSNSLVGLVVPHAGYMYSGPVAAHSYKLLAQSPKPLDIVIVGPNHTGYGTGVSTMAMGEWATPLGNAPIDSQLSKEIVKRSGLIDVEELAHKYEHSVEVQLPFLQHLYGSHFKFVPVCMMLQDLETSRNVGRAIAESVRGGRIMLIASSDWTHYEPHEIARKKDMKAISGVLDLDEEKFQACIEHDMVSACGYGPVTTLIVAAKLLGAKRANLLSYQTSGDITGDKSAVVGYASIAFMK